MPCYRPLHGWRSPGGQIVFKLAGGYSHARVAVPCGQCIGCRIKRSQEWGVRCIHEASLHDTNSFITLTYDDQNLPYDHSLDVTHFQDFMRKLRKKLKPKNIRFFHCGEYGENFHRPHYHALIFNHDFPDREYWKTENGKPIYQSEELTDTWEFGLCTTSDISFAACAYVARYVIKKITGEKAEEHYLLCDSDTGEIHTLKPEYATMSRGGNKKGAGGIGQAWFEKFKTDVYPSDFLILNGKKIKPPKFYDMLLEKEDQACLSKIKQTRKKYNKQRKEDNTDARLNTREVVKTAQVNSLTRRLEKL